MSIMWPYPAVFNVLDPWWNSGSGYKPLVPNDTTKAADNTSALLEIIALAQASKRSRRFSGKSRSGVNPLRVLYYAALRSASVIV